MLPTFVFMLALFFTELTMWHTVNDFVMGKPLSGVDRGVRIFFVCLAICLWGWLYYLSH